MTDETRQREGGGHRPKHPPVIPDKPIVNPKAKHNTMTHPTPQPVKPGDEAMALANVIESESWHKLDCSLDQKWMSEQIDRHFAALRDERDRLELERNKWRSLATDEKQAAITADAWATQARASEENTQNALNTVIKRATAAEAERDELKLKLQDAHMDGELKVRNEKSELVDILSKRLETAEDDAANAKELNAVMRRSRDEFEQRMVAAEAAVAKLRKTKDGVPVVPGMRLWAKHEQEAWILLLTLLK